MFTTNRCTTRNGFTLVELVLFIAIMGVAVGGVLIAYDFAARDSADPVVKKQALAIAESLLEEIQQMPFTFCDPDDANVSTATAAVVGPTGCATTVEALGPEAGETRYSPTTPFDNVNDYGAAISGDPGFSMNPIRDITNTVIAGLEAYTATVRITDLPANTLPGIPAGDALLINVTVTGPANVSVSIDGYRTRYAPRL